MVPGDHEELLCPDPKPQTMRTTVVLILTKIIHNCIALLCCKRISQPVSNVFLLYGFVQCHWKLLLWTIKISFANSETSCLLMPAD